MANLPKADELIGSTVTQQQFKTKLRQLVENIDRSYSTLAEANADIANISVGVKVEVLNAVDGGLYEKSTAGATSLTKSAYDPVKLSQDFVNENRLFNPFRQNATDFNTVLTPGFNLVVSAASATTEYNAPIQKPGLLRALKAPNSALVSQVYEPFDGSGAFYRTYDGNVFTPWISQWDSSALLGKLANFLPKDDAYRLSTALDDKDLNTVVKFDIYSQSSRTSATLERNYPVAGRRCFLEVLQGSATSIVVQRLTYLLNGDIQVYVRDLTSGVWSEWKTASAFDLSTTLQRKIPARAEFLFPDDLTVTFNVDTRVLTWNKPLLFATSVNASNRVNISPGSKAIGDALNFAIVYIDLTALPENGNITDPPTSAAIKVGAYNSGYFESMNFIPIAKIYNKTAGTKAYACAGFPEILNVGSSIIPDTQDSASAFIEVEKTANLINIYKNGSGSNGFKFTFRRTTDANIQLDAWGMEKTYQVNLNKTTLKEVVTDGVWETALMPSGNVNDHSGGTHGDELLSSAYFLCDGVYYDQNATFAKQCKTLTCIQKSNVYVQDSTQLFCEKTQAWNIDDEKMVLDLELYFPSQISSKHMWITMLPILRDNVTSKQIRSTSFDVVDVSTTSFPRNEEQVKPGDYVILSGSDISVKVTIEKLENCPAPFWFVANSAAYNKVYVSASSREDTVISAGTRMKIRSTYEFNCMD